MTTKIATMAGKLVVVSGLAMALTLGGPGLAQAEHNDKDNYFVQHPGPASGRTGVDLHDPYAPVVLGRTLVVDGGALAVERFAAAIEIAGEWAAPPAPGMPGQPY